ncbi:glutamate--cysteine ligase [Kitasatospora sp. NPDC057015]|uniref:carboxylate-amine ligase n=1 Tax=Kitasatospora sp. NPDC057015 TaxID=3346001 RepID=UPI00363257E7
MLTFGIEEEYLLVDEVSGVPVPRAAEVLAAADLLPALRPEEAQHELLQVQVEVATPVCEELAEAADHLVRLRDALGTAARKAGCRIAPVGAAPFQGLMPVPVTDRARYRSARADAPQLVDDLMLNGMHVHVGVPDRDSGIAVLNRLRPWLPVLVAMAANSPFWQGRETGFASWRTIHFDRWPASGQPPAFRDAADYERRVRALQDTGLIRDRGALYWHARLSERYPTIEVRAADVQLLPQDAELFAALVRALVATALADDRAGVPPLRPDEELLRAATWQAAHNGLDGRLASPNLPYARPAGSVVEELMAYAAPGLAAVGDTERVGELLEAFLAAGTGARRQRLAWHRGGRAGLIDLLVG